MTETEMRQHMAAQRMGASFGATGRERAERPQRSMAASAMRVPPPPSQVGAIQSIGGAATAIGSGIAGIINPILGLMVGLAGGMVTHTQAVGQAGREAQQAQRIAQMNRRAQGEAQLSQVRAASTQQRGQLAALPPPQPGGQQPQQLEPGGAEQMATSLLGRG